MAYESVLAAFPRRPLALTRPGVGKGLLGLMLVLTLLCVGGAAYFVSEYLPGILTDRALATGATEVPGRIGGRCETRRGFITTCDLVVTYEATDKRRHEVTTPILIFGSLDQSQPLSVRQDRTNPDRVGTSWGYLHLTDRWIALGAMTALCLLFAGLCVAGTLRMFKVARQQREAAASPRPTVVTIEGVKRTKANADWRYAWVEGVRRFTGQQTFTGQAQPLWIDPQRAQALALVGPNGGSLLLDGTMSQIQLTEAERMAVMGAIARVQPQ